MSTRNLSKVEAVLRAMEAFRKLKRATQADVAVHSELHPNTISRYTQLLNQRGWITPVGSVPTGKRGGPSLVWEWRA